MRVEMEKNQKRWTIGGVVIFLGGAIANDTIAYIWRGFVELLTAGASGVTWQTFPWMNALGVFAMIAGAIVLIWPWISRQFTSRFTDDDDTHIPKFTSGELKAITSSLNRDIQNVAAAIPENNEKLKLLTDEWNILDNHQQGLRNDLTSLSKSTSQMQEKQQNVSKLLIQVSKILSARELLHKLQSIPSLEAIKAVPISEEAKNSDGLNDDGDDWLKNPQFHIEDVTSQIGMLLGEAKSRELKERLDYVERDVRGDAIKSNKSDDDQYYWRSSETKRKWNTLNDQITEIKRFVAKEQDVVKKSAEASFIDAIEEAKLDGLDI